MNIGIGEVIAILVGLIIGDCLYFVIKKTAIFIKSIFLKKKNKVT